MKMNLSSPIRFTVVGYNAAHSQLVEIARGSNQTFMGAWKFAKNQKGAVAIVWMNNLYSVVDGREFVIEEF